MSLGGISSAEGRQPGEAAGARIAAPDAFFIREAHRLTADLATPDRSVYWLDLLGLSLCVYGGLAAAVLEDGLAQAGGFILFVLALYRGVSFIHELAHLRPGDIPAFKAAWLVLIGVPFLVPALLYEGVHNLHHAKQRYGTPADPEYASLSHWSLPQIAGFVAIALLAPLGAYLRFAVAAPLSFLSPTLRREVVGRLSAMTVNTGFRREDHDRAARPDWLAQEIACWLWSWSLTAIALTSAYGLRAVLISALGLSIMALVNQLRTLVAHAWTNDGAPMSFEAQFRDSINVPPPALLPVLWAPVGLRYHALHHLLPRIPYHNLAEAHRRLHTTLPVSARYGETSHAGLLPAARALLSRASRRLAS